jgi:hypothetical protein
MCCYLQPRLKNYQKVHSGTSMCGSAVSRFEIRMIGLACCSARCPKNYFQKQAKRVHAWFCPFLFQDVLRTYACRSALCVSKSQIQNVAEAIYVRFPPRATRPDISPAALSFQISHGLLIRKICRRFPHGNREGVTNTASFSLILFYSPLPSSTLHNYQNHQRTQIMFVPALSSSRNPQVRSYAVLRCIPRFKA